MIHPLATRFHAGLPEGHGDGEDEPTDVVRLIRKLKNDLDQKVIFAERLRRSEGLFFTSFYWFYRQAHRILTGIPVRVGNFSAVPFELIRRLVVLAELWNHYTASVVRSRLPFDMVPTSRAKRLVGRSKMNFTSLCIHGLSAISVFSDYIGVRMLSIAVFILAVFVLGVFITMLAQIGVGLAVPGWAWLAIGIIIFSFLHLITTLIVFVFGILGNRDSAVFIPIRDYEYFVSG